MIKNCCVCEKIGAFYKCPTCKKPYCSVACCKEHKTQVCEPPPIPEGSNETEGVNEQKYEFSTEDTVSVHRLQQLRHSEEVKQCLTNSHVRDIVRSILNSPNPTTAIASAMTEPIFVELANACLKVVELPDEDKPC